MVGGRAVLGGCPFGRQASELQERAHHIGCVPVIHRLVEVDNPDRLAVPYRVLAADIGMRESEHIGALRQRTQPRIEVCVFRPHRFSVFRT